MTNDIPKYYLCFKISSVLQSRKTKVKKDLRKPYRDIIFLCFCFSIKGNETVVTQIRTFCGRL